MKILVTGAGGLIGGSVVALLRAEHYHVIAVHRTKPPAQSAPVDFLEADLTQPSAVELLAAAGPEVVVHCAAVLPKSLSDDGASAAAKANRGMDGVVLGACGKLRCRLIYCSSSSVYGLSGSPWSEDSPLAPPGGYARAKVETEAEIGASGLSHAILRISSPYGPAQRVENVLAIFIKRALQNQDLLYHGRGSRRQNFVAAADVAEAVSAAIARPGATGVFNVAVESSISMKELAALVVACVAGSTSRVLASGTDDLQETYRAELDLRKARAVLGWTPRTSLRQGILDWAAQLRQPATAGGAGPGAIRQPMRAS